MKELISALLNNTRLHLIHEPPNAFGWLMQHLRDITAQWSPEHLEFMGNAEVQNPQRNERYQVMIVWQKKNGNERPLFHFHRVYLATSREEFPVMVEVWEYQRFPWWRAAIDALTQRFTVCFLQPSLHLAASDAGLAPQQIRCFDPVELHRVHPQMDFDWYVTTVIGLFSTWCPASLSGYEVVEHYSQFRLRPAVQESTVMPERPLPNSYCLLLVALPTVWRELDAILDAHLNPKLLNSEGALALCLKSYSTNISDGSECSHQDDNEIPKPSVSPTTHHHHHHPWDLKSIIDPLGVL